VKGSLDSGAVPDSSTKNTRLSSSFDGAEIGSTGTIAMWSYPDVSSVNANKTINANDNFAPQELAQAA